MIINHQTIGLLRNLFLLQVVILHAAYTCEGYFAAFGPLPHNAVLKTILVYNEYVQPTTVLAFLSAVLFFNNVPKQGLDIFFEKKLRSRFGSIFLPLIAWSLITIALFNLYAFFAGNSLNPNGLMVRLLLTDVSLLRAASFLVTDTPLWFLYDLLVLFLLSPLIFVVARVWWLFWPLFIFLAAFSFEGFGGDLFGVLKCRFVMFYLIGCYVAIREVEVFQLVLAYGVRIGLLLAALCGIAYLFQSQLDEHNLATQFLIFVLFNSLAFVVTLQLANFVVTRQRIKHVVSFFTKNSFFLYVSHIYHCCNCKNECPAVR